MVVDQIISFWEIFFQEQRYADLNSCGFPNEWPGLMKLQVVLTQSLIHAVVQGSTTVPPSETQAAK